MKGLVFHGERDVRIDELPVPVISDEQVLVQVMACGVCGTDLHIYQGAKGAADCTPPTVLGHEFSGVVVQTGKHVAGWQVGDRVAIDPNNTCGSCPACLGGKAHFCTHMIGTGTTADGGFAEYCAVHPRQLYRIDGGLSFEEGAMAEPVSCCLHGLDLTEVRPGARVMVIGGGTIGQIMVRLCRLAGAAQIVLSEPVERKRELGLASGADLALDPLAPDFMQKLAESCPGKFDRVIECVGNPATIQTAIQSVGNGGTVMLFGLTEPECGIPLYPFYLFQHEITIKASYINPYTIGRAVALLNSGRLRVDDLITDRIPLSRGVPVFTDDSYRTHGKIILRPQV